MQAKFSIEELEAILDYMYADEKKAWEDEGKPQAHIYHTLEAIRLRVEKQKRLIMIKDTIDQAAKAIDQVATKYGHNKKYLVLTFSDHSRFALPTEALASKLVEIVKKDMALKMAAKYDLDYSEALKQVRVDEEVEDHHLIMYSYVMCWADFAPQATQLDDGHAVANFQEELESCQRVIMTELELDRYKTQKSAL